MESCLLCWQSNRSPPAVLPAVFLSSPLSSLSSWQALFHHTHSLLCADTQRHTHIGFYLRFSFLWHAFLKTHFSSLIWHQASTTWLFFFFPFFDFSSCNWGFINMLPSTLYHGKPLTQHTLISDSPLSPPVSSFSFSVCSLFNALLVMLITHITSSCASITACLLTTVELRTVVSFLVSWRRFNEAVALLQHP